MKYLTKKVIKGRRYFYLQYKNYTKNLGIFPSEDLKSQFKSFFRTIGEKEFVETEKEFHHEFKYCNLKKLEKLHFEYVLIKHELFLKEYSNFLTNFSILFTYNSNRAEGSKITKKEIQDFCYSKKRVVKTKTEIEIQDSFDALHFALFEMENWNLLNIRHIHERLLDRVDPLIAGQFKNENNVAPGNQPTVDFKNVAKEMKFLMEWLNKKFKEKPYPPLLALEFYARFERIHPFLDGNGRVGRILLNAILNKYDYPLIVFFSLNKVEHCTAIKQFLENRPVKLRKHFCHQMEKTYNALKLF